MCVAAPMDTTSVVQKRKKNSKVFFLLIYIVEKIDELLFIYFHDIGTPPP